jgi:uncharacterized protein
MKLTFDEIRDNKNFLLLKCISGSKAYGLNTPQSDTDLKGVFLLPQKNLYGLNHPEQVSDEKQDETYFELGRFIQLLLTNNPTIIELLNTPHDCILYRHPIMQEIKPHLFLSKLCKNSFAGYAHAQIKKAQGLNKKIVNPVEKERKSILEFCYVIKGAGTIPLKDWLEENNFRQEECGLVNIPHMKDLYAVFHSSQINGGHFKGIFSGVDANDVSLSSVPKGIDPLATLSFNKDGYTKYCKDYRNYWNWVEERNEARYENTIEHGKNYDAKNLMHTFRLLAMAEEIALYKEVRVRRTDRDFLLRIRKGEFLYEDLVKQAEEKTEKINELFEKSDLPEKPDETACENLLISMRQKLYTI